MTGFGQVLIPIYALTLIFGLPMILIFMGLRRGGKREKDRTQWNEETRIMQELHDDVSKMEARIEALETILMERFRKE